MASSFTLNRGRRSTQQQPHEAQGVHPYCAPDIPLKATRSVSAAATYGHPYYGPCSLVLV